MYQWPYAPPPNMMPYPMPPMANEHDIKKTIKQLKMFLREQKTEKEKKNKPPPKKTFTVGETLGILLLTGPFVAALQYYGLLYIFTQITMSLHNINVPPH